ncbi:MAG TPA: hypothetical protein VG935_00665 [Patescibacteria group bacterium]|nr:hypothetical protein [Patescibacteria group bacterium]
MVEHDTYISPYKKRPHSRSEELARLERADKRLAQRLGELPRRQTLFERIQGHYVAKARRELDNQ